MNQGCSLPQSACDLTQVLAWTYPRLWGEQLDISKADPILHCVSEDRKDLELAIQGTPNQGESHVSVTKALKRLASWVVNTLNWVLGAAFFFLNKKQCGAEVKSADLLSVSLSERWE